MSRDPAVSHALLVRQSIQLDNYHKFFQLYRITHKNKEIYEIDNMRVRMNVKIFEISMTIEERFADNFYRG